MAERARRPSDFAPRSPEIEADPGRPCPFCPGHEDATLRAARTPSSAATTGRCASSPTCTRRSTATTGFVVHHLGPVHVTADASGVHEVFVYTPDHDGGLHQLSDEDAAEVMHVLQRRLAAHAAAPEVRYTQVIVNHGREAGASLAHPHAQILGLPVRARRDPRRGARVRPLRRRLRDLHHDRGRAHRRGSRGVRRRRRRVRRPVLERRPVRAAADAAPPRGPPAGRRPGQPRRHRPRHPRRRRAPQRGARRPVVQPRVPHRAARALRPVPLARAPVAEPRHRGRLRTRHRRHDQRDAARDGRRHAARRPRPA